MVLSGLVCLGWLVFHSLFTRAWFFCAVRQFLRRRAGGRGGSVVFGGAGESAGAALVASDGARAGFTRTGTQRMCLPLARGGEWRWSTAAALAFDARRRLLGVRPSH